MPLLISTTELPVGSAPITMAAVPVALEPTVTPLATVIVTLTGEEPLHPALESAESSNQLLVFALMVKL
jgi:hypothetical protein